VNLTASGPKLNIALPNTVSLVKVVPRNQALLLTLAFRAGCPTSGALIVKGAPELG
jgi:hypothetical protein